MGMSERGCADVCGRCGCKGKVGNGWGEGPVRMSERGCAEVRGRCGCKGSERGCEDVRGRCRCKGTGGNGWGEGPVGMSERGCADVCGRCGCKGKGWKWVGGRTGGHERAWMRGSARTVSVQGKGVK